MQFWFGGPWRHIRLPRKQFHKKKGCQPETYPAIADQPDQSRIWSVYNNNKKAYSGRIHKNTSSIHSGRHVYHSFDYWSVVGMINYLEKGWSPHIGYDVHQCIRFFSNPQQRHSDAFIHLCKYLQVNGDQGIIVNSNKYLQLYQNFIPSARSGNQT